MDMNTKYTRRTRYFIFVLLILFLFIISVSPASAFQVIKAKVQRVVDGDTVVAIIEGKKERIRFIGVDTPETVKPRTPAEPFGRESSDFTKKALTGKTVWLEMDVSPRDKYKRLLAYVWLSPPEDDEITEDEIREDMFNAVLLLGGYAQLMTIPPNVKYADSFTRFQTEAREQVRGLWSRYCALQ
jgi:micrococcal nuclease